MKIQKNKEKRILVLSFTLVLAVFFGAKFGIVELNAAESNGTKTEKTIKQTKATRSAQLRISQSNDLNASKERIKAIVNGRDARISSPSAARHGCGMLAIKKNLKLEQKAATQLEKSGVISIKKDSLVHEKRKGITTKKVEVIDSGSLIIGGPVVNVPVRGKKSSNDKQKRYLNMKGQQK